VHEGLMFTSVRGSGHEKSLFRPKKAHNSLLLHLSRLYLLINLIIPSVVVFKFCGFQEIALLCQFEYENIVEYSGTDNLLCLFLF
jgi:hypothetical protein